MAPNPDDPRNGAHPVALTVSVPRSAPGAGGRVAVPGSAGGGDVAGGGSGAVPEGPQLAFGSVIAMVLPIVTAIAGC